MSTFGTVVPGFGTIQAFLAAGGVADTLQASSVAFVVVFPSVRHGQYTLCNLLITRVLSVQLAV
jgi:hypothetical protein